MKTFLSLSKEVTKDGDGKPRKGYGKKHLRFNVLFALKFNVLLKRILNETIQS